MIYYHFRGSEPNFGDELNNWLMPKVFPRLFDGNPDTLLLGIGSILYDHHPKGSLKIVFGSGYGGYTPPPTLDEGWRVYNVRGPRTAERLGLRPSASAGDAAILVNSYRDRSGQKDWDCAFIPHFESIERGGWQAACKLAGINFIDPRWEPELVMSSIERSKLVITEAMHGAIVADALRTPWIPILPFHASHRFKWSDWAEALRIDLKPLRLVPSSSREAWVTLTRRDGLWLRPETGRFPRLTRVSDRVFTHLAAADLRRLAAREPILSKEAELDRALDRLQSDAVKIQKDFGA